MSEIGLRSIMVAGEYCGPGIQSNRIHLKTRDWYLFDVRENGKRCGLEELQRVARILGFKTVPVEEVGTGFDEKYPTVEAVLERANGHYETGASKEGIVIRPTVPTYSNVIDAYLSMKAVSNKYLLKNE
jgi:ATP-dependent RNA circularization protein (DNA/RNA ligase family)